MSSVRALANLLCARCADVTLHSANICQREGCGQVNHDSGNPPVPKPARPYGYSTMKAKHYDASLQEQGDARRRARAARHQVMRGRT